MKYNEILTGKGIIEKLYAESRGALQLKARRLLKPLIEALEAFVKEQERLFREAGAVEVERDGQTVLELKVVPDETREAIEKMFLEDVPFAEAFTLEESAELLNNPEIDFGVKIGLIKE